MRITNTTSGSITLTDLDRGNAGTNSPNTGIYESWNSKCSSAVPANDFIDVLDTDNVLLSTELGQIKKYKDASVFTTQYSMTGREVGPVAIVGSTNDTFKVDIAGGGFQSFTLPTGASVTIDDVVTSINGSATGFSAEKSDGFFRSSNMDNVTSSEEIQGDLGYGYGERGTAIENGFLVLVSDGIVTVGDGNANATLGFTELDKTKSK